ncbi:MAG: photosystem II protein PsbQ [Gomphosphaeria aponina SAG 52.96 = DSM 107014]|uniref:Photosystem II protein PsbQ n=1 Tax=Gomphosphaeria aponina SAG 52.96 = DSM 107014 TaxID=1521640 RepID=A0A941GU70_9CHRO|nr:photosystem II protein PsbQ [Gomphosphaeria aponina SAG 52.96 = DSM 107014]
MLRFRSLLPLILALVATFLVSCGGPSAKIPTTYSPEKIQAIQAFAAPVEAARERMSELQSYIQAENWVETGSLIHGPLGSLRRDIRYLAEELLPKDQKQAKTLAQELFQDLEQIDTAAKARNYGEAVSRYRNAINDFDAFLDLIPKSGETT